MLYILYNYVVNWPWYAITLFLLGAYHFYVIAGYFLGGGGKKFIVFVVKALNVNILQTIEEIIDYLYLQYKQQPQK